MKHNPKLSSKFTNRRRIKLHWCDIGKNLVQRAPALRAAQGLRGCLIWSRRRCGACATRAPSCGKAFHSNTASFRRWLEKLLFGTSFPDKLSAAWSRLIDAEFWRQNTSWADERRDRSEWLSFAPRRMQNVYFIRVQQPLILFVRKSQVVEF